MPEKRNIIKKVNNTSTKNSKFPKIKKQFMKQKPSKKFHKKPFKKFDKKINKNTPKKPFVKFFKGPKIVRTPWGWIKNTKKYLASSSESQALRLRYNQVKYYERFISKKKNPNKKKYYAFYKKKRNNIFITVTQKNGNVIASQSAGFCKIRTKKRKRSPDTLKTVAISISRAMKSKNINFIYKLFTTQRSIKPIKTIFDGFKKSGVKILQNVTINNKPHAEVMRKKKKRRL